MSETNIIRVVKGRENPYSMIANFPVLDKHLSFRARGILWLCLSRPDNWQFNAVYLNNMSEREGRDAINHALRELEECHYIFRTQVRDPATMRWLGSIWLVFELPYDQLYKDENLTTIQRMLEDEAQRRFFEPCTENPFTDIPSTEKPCTEKPHLLNTEYIVNTDGAKTGDRAASPASLPPSQPVLLTPDPDQTTAFNGELDALFQNALKVEAQADGKRGPQKWGSLAQKQQYRAAAQKIVERKGVDELQRAIAEGLKRERKSRDSLVAWIRAWADNLDKPHPDSHRTTDATSQAFTREKARRWYGDRGNRDAGYQPGVDTSSPAFTREKARLWYGDRGNRDDGYQPG